MHFKYLKTGEEDVTTFSFLQQYHNNVVNFNFPFSSSTPGDLLSHYHRMFIFQLLLIFRFVHPQKHDRFNYSPLIFQCLASSIFSMSYQFIKRDMLFQVVFHGKNPPFCSTSYVIPFNILPMNRQSFLFFPNPNISCGRETTSVFSVAILHENIAGYINLADAVGISHQSEHIFADMSHSRPCLYA